MINTHRRQVCVSLACSVLGARSRGARAARVGSQDTLSHFGRSGDDALDQALIIELKRIVRVLEINPGFRYIDEMNAFASVETIIEGTQGTVYLGLPLVKQLLEKADGGAGVAGVCAHECAHIYQFDHGIYRQSESVRVVELHADFVAGYYMGRRKEYTADKI